MTHHPIEKLPPRIKLRHKSYVMFSIAGAFMLTGMSESLIGVINAIFAVIFFSAGCWILYCAYDMESGPHE